MNDTKLKNIIAEAVILDREIAEQTERLKELKKQIIEEAKSREEEATKTDGGCKSITFDGSDGCIARVVFPAPSLKSKIDGEGKTIEKIKAIAKGMLNRLFTPAVTYHPIEKFRDEAVGLLGNAEGKKLIKLCESNSSATVSFETKEKSQ